jgi:predicted nucleic acid-binding protein
MPNPPAAWARPNLLGLTIYRDNNMLDEGRDAARDVLLRMHREGWVQFSTTDTALTESTSAADPAVGERLFDEISTGWTSRGPVVLDHSLPDVGMLASDDDQARLEQVHQLIWGHPWADDAEATGRTPRNRIRDTMHVATAIRYNGDAFVTDDEDVQHAAGAIVQQFRMPIWSPEQAVAELATEITLMRKRWQRDNYQPALPDWPSTEDIAAWSPGH